MTEGRLYVVSREHFPDVFHFSALLLLKQFTRRSCPIRRQRHRDGRDANGIAAPIRPPSVKGKRYFVNDSPYGPANGRPRSPRTPSHRPWLSRPGRSLNTRALGYDTTAPRCPGGPLSPG